MSLTRPKGLEGNAIEAGTTTNMDTFAKDYAYRTLAAHGLAVGLSDGLMGKSEVRSVPVLSFRLTDGGTQTLEYWGGTHRVARYRLDRR